MECPFCHKQQTFVVNTRTTSKNSQIWRRRRCEACKKVFTTHEKVDLSHLIVIKSSGKAEKFSHAKLYSGIYGATIGSKTPNREFVVDKITNEVEREILYLNSKRVKSSEIGDIVLKKLKKRNISTFMRFLTYHKKLKSVAQTKREIKKYLE